MSEEIRWNSKISFLVAMIGSAVGLGNIWRYPYVAYSNGGGAFLLPYIISIICIGIPLLFVEYGAGFKFKAGISKVLRTINTKYEYIAWYIQLVPFFIMTYYSCIVAWDLIYIPTSIVKGWGSNPESYFVNVVLNNVDGFAGFTHISLYVLIAITIIWLISWFISHRDINSGLAKANKILIPLLFIIMIGIVFYGLSLPGAMIGVNSLITPDFNRILDSNIWLAAFGQIFFSLNLGLTIVLAYASYLPDDVDIPKSALTVAFTNSIFEVFTAFGIFGILGYMSQTSGIAINKLITEGTGLAFIAFPEVFNLMGITGNIIGPLFFICILFAGITSLLSLIEPVTLSINNKFGFGRRNTVKLLCIVGFLISLLYCTGCGSTIIGLWDAFLNQFGLILNGILEIIIIGWIYGLDKLTDGLNKNATLFKLGDKWIFIVKYILPIILGIMWISGMYSLFETGDTFSLLMQIIIILILIIVPYIFTKLPAKNDDY
ncbi:MAG: sodium-dependent transporter [Methanosphaera stadtmanae]|jgi:NSS family neurotransmitter:Na+ symporter|nr:sodium-dependent transporter [Methanosphaera stadtmanae]